MLPKIEKRWFIPGSPTCLACLRIVVAAYALMYLYSRKSFFMRIAGTSADLFDPVGLTGFLRSPLPEHVFAAAFYLAIVAGVFFLLGAGFRVSGPLFAGMLLLVLCYRNSWSMIYHSDNLLVFHVLILGFSRAADAASVDAAIGRIVARSGRITVGNRCVAAWRYGWPVQLICAVTLLTYFLAGVAKVAGPMGWSWVAGESLRLQVAVDVVRKELLVDETPMLARFLFEHVWLFTLAGVATLVIEIGAPLAILSRRFSRVWVIATFAMHWGILLVMGIKFRYQLSGVVFFSFVIRDYFLSRPHLADPESTSSRAHPHPLPRSA